MGKKKERGNQFFGPFLINIRAIPDLMTGKAAKFLCLAAGLAISATFGMPSAAQEAAVSVGPVTGLKLPRYVSIKKRARARRGPSTKHRIDWVFVRPNLPVRVIQEHEHWRRVEDSEGFGGWIHYAFLSSSRYALITKDHHEIRYKPTMAGKAMAKASAGVIVALDECRPQWCLVEAGDHRGWTTRSGLWGLSEGETFE